MQDQSITQEVIDYYLNAYKITLSPNLYESVKGSFERMQEKGTLTYDELGRICAPCVNSGLVQITCTGPINRTKVQAEKGEQDD